MAIFALPLKSTTASAAKRSLILFPLFSPVEFDSSAVVEGKGFKEEEGTEIKFFKSDFGTKKHFSFHQTTLDVTYEPQFQV